MGRIIGGIAAGLVVAIVIVMGLEMIGHAFYPQPSEADFRDLPVWVQMWVLGGWFLGAMVGGAVAASISRRAWTAWLIAAFVAAGGIVIIFMMPHPELMQIGAVVAPAVGGLVAGHFARARLRGPTAAA